MKQVLISLFIGAAVLSCSKQQPDPNVETNVMLEEPSGKVADAADSGTPGAEGKQLIAGMDCLTCHKEDAKLVGPSYQEIAAKYTDADIDMLADKIINGGSGVWGPAAMTPHAGLSKENAKKMVEYILTLKK